MSQQLALLSRSEGMTADSLREVIREQHALMASQLALVSGTGPDVHGAVPSEALAAVPAAGPVVAASAVPDAMMDADRPPAPGARLGRTPEGVPAWYVPDPQRPGGYLKVAG